MFEKKIYFSPDSLFLLPVITQNATFSLKRSKLATPPILYLLLPCRKLRSRRAIIPVSSGAFDEPDYFVSVSMTLLPVKIREIMQIGEIVGTESVP